MKVIPMLFQTELVRALLEGRKTVTRRPVNEKNHEHIRFMGSSDDECSNLEFLGLNYAQWKDENNKTRGPEYLVYCTEYPEEGIVPIGQGPARKGDLIYVRETFAALGHNDYQQVSPNHITEIHEYRYKASEKESIANCQDYEVRGYKWVPSIHMPRHASRLTLKVTDVRIERVKDVTEEEAKKEGVSPYTCTIPKTKNPHRLAFLKLWSSLYGNKNPNPYVWVIEFDVIHKNVDQVISKMEAA
ncbi:hypothetical protein TW81_02085 [Vibrio galatheae]|uniref:ASCH domain-containing protein n=1 Tax=Vibrio galatheae TaxID=579748 RepID=A0A0F4NNW7_9VIBR|nr:ASCH domain-containing protein [Vibrio galatheae]KJY84807.1 hypothetical protein TW81_02085 [Vibrio galatheae]